MHQHIQAVILASALGLGAASAQAQPWKVLFDGKTYAGWEDPTKKSPPATSFTIEDACLKATAHPPFEEDLFTKDTFHDFELEFEWKISPKGNSGIKYRIQDRVIIVPDPAVPKFEDRANAAMKNRRTDRPARGQEYVIGFEYQITDNALNSDALSAGPLHSTAALYDVFAPLRDATKPVGEFNLGRIVVKGDHVEHWLNGVKVVDASLKAPQVAASAEKRWGKGSPVYHLLADQPRQRCQISLQNHGDLAWFRNIRIRSLD